MAELDYEINVAGNLEVVDGLVVCWLELNRTLKGDTGLFLDDAPHIALNK